MKHIKMKLSITLLTALCALVSANPNGYYHQAYNYKTSASSFKNNELQHKTDDQGYYEKQGDLEGRVRPKINANSEHSEYVNPNSKAAYTSDGAYYNGNQEMSSNGNLVARGSYGGSAIGGYGSSGYSQNLASSDNIAGAAGSYGSASSTFGSYGSSGASSLNSVASSVQRDLLRDMTLALHRQTAYQNSIDALEDEIRRNLTEKFNQALIDHYGQQSIRGGQSYSIHDGRLQTAPNYQQQELVNIQRQIENSLLGQLRRDYNQRVVQEAHHENYVHYEKTTSRPVVIYRPAPQRVYSYEPIRMTAPEAPTPYHYSQNTNVESLTSIASKVQNNLDNELNRVLNMIGSQPHNSQYLTLERLQSELRNNITRFLEDEISSQYGTQVQRDGYMFTSGQHNHYNYKMDDIENIKKQVEQNLISKLNREYQNQIARVQSTQYQESQKYSASSGYQGSMGYQGSAGYQGTVGQQGSMGHQGMVGHHGSAGYPDTQNYYGRDYDTTTPNSYVDYYRSTRPTAASIVPLVIESGMNQDSFASSSNYGGASQSGYGVSSSQSIAALKQQLESELSRQVQQAINQNQRYASQYASQGYSNLQAYDSSLKRLSEELNRNLTSQLQQYIQGGSFSSSYGGGFNQGQLESLKSNLQNELSRQLQQGLTQMYSASASYSASSSHSSSSGDSYRSARGSDAYTNYGGYRQSAGQYTGADCDE